VPINQRSSPDSIGIGERHPLLLEVDEDYVLMNDSLKGQRVIKDQNVTYLPPTSGMVADGLFTSPSSSSVVFNTRSLGYAAYSAYLLRANYPSFIQDALDILIGVMHREPPRIELPPELEPMLKVATRRGESLPLLLQKINEAQLIKGRIGLLADVAVGRPTPHLVWYAAENVINWDDDRETEFGLDKLKFLVLDETRLARGLEGEDRYAWDVERRFRQLDLGGFADLDGEGTPVSTAIGTYTTFVEVDGLSEPRTTPNFRGRTLDEIPFVFIGSTDLDPDPARIPLLPLANLALAVYRGDADYRQCLFMQGQDTLVVIGATNSSPGSEEPEKSVDRRVGAGAVIELPLTGDAKYIGINGDGLPEMAKALDADQRKAREMGSRLLEPRGSQAESGEALKIRVGASVAHLRKIALVGAAGLEAILKVCARWVGADENAVKVVPNLDFADAKRGPADALSMTQAKKEGLPISDKSVHRWMQDNDLTKMTYEEEIAEMKTEATLVADRLEAFTPPQPQAPPANGGPPSDSATGVKK